MLYLIEAGVAAVNRVTTAEHYSNLQRFYARLNEDSSIHLPLWVDGTRTLRDANRNAQVLMARISSPRPGQRILDAGCGLGATSIWLAREFGVHVVGVSNSASNIDACRRAAAAAGLSSLATFETADLTDEFADPESFDAIWSLESLNYIHAKDSFVQRVWKALRPGGLWLCMDRFIDTSRLTADDRDLQAITRDFYSDAQWDSADALLTYMDLTGFGDTHFDNLTAMVLAAPRRKRIKLSCAGAAVAAALCNPRSFQSMLRAFRIARASYNLMTREAMTYGLLRGRRREQ